MKRSFDGKSTVYSVLIDTWRRRGGGFLLLLDPDQREIRHLTHLAELAENSGVDALLVGGSMLVNGQLRTAVASIRQASNLPIILFPGSHAQVCELFDAILFTSLISSRNPTYLIEEQVKGAPLVRQANVEPIPTGYLLIESGSLTSVQFMSGSLPIPRSKSDIACAHALAAQYMGMKLVYLEAGSGASLAVPTEMIQAVRSTIDIPIIVGGGLRTPEACRERVEAGASFIVVGTRMEENPDKERLQEMTAAVHILEPALA